MLNKTTKLANVALEKTTFMNWKKLTYLLVFFGVVSLPIYGYAGDPKHNSGGAKEIAIPDYKGSLEPPSEIFFVDRSETSLTLRWEDRSENEVGFRLERRIAGCGWKQIYETMHADPRKEHDALVILSREKGVYYAFKDRNLSADTKYCYRVASYNVSNRSLSKERSVRTLPETDIIFKRKLPSMFTRHNRIGDFILKPGDITPCVDDVVRERILSLLEFEDMPEEVEDAVYNMLNQSYICEGGSWDITDLDDIFKDLWDKIEGTVECTFAIAAVATVCSAEVALCIYSIIQGDEVDYKGCITDSNGVEHCPSEGQINIPGWACLLEAGLAIEGYDPCVETIKWAADVCGLDSD